MNSAEKLAKLCPKSPSLTGGFGGIPEITAQDLAAAMAAGRMSRAEANVLWILYCDDQRVETRTELIRDLLLEVAGWTESRRFQEQWEHGQRGGKIAIVCRMAIAEMEYDTRCHACGARGVDLNQRKCTQCGGTGKRPLTEGDRAKAAEQTKQEWDRHFAWYYALVWGHVVSLGSDGLRKFAKGLGKDITASTDNHVAYTRKTRVAKEKVSVRLDPAHARWVQNTAREQRVTVSHVLNQALAHYLSVDTA